MGEVEFGSYGVEQGAGEMLRLCESAKRLETMYNSEKERRWKTPRMFVALEGAEGERV